MAIENDAGASALPSSTELALDRTLLAHDRALMAWVRTATSLISFGRHLQLQFRKKLKRVYPEVGSPLTTIMATLIAVLGILALIAVILRQ